MVSGVTETIREAEAEALKYKKEAKRLRKKVADLKIVVAGLELVASDNKLLKEFARRIIEQECWVYSPLDGDDIQDLVEKLGLIVPHIVTKEDVDESSDYVEGDNIYVFSEILKK